MGGKATSIYLTVCPKGSHISVFKKVFFEAKAYNEFVRDPAFIEKYPKDRFDVIKETY
jgi:hypothetical protein